MRSTLACIFAGLLFGCSTSLPPEAEHYRRARDTASLNQTLHRDVRPGDSVARVERLLGPGDRKDQAKQLSFTKLCAERAPKFYPDGVQEGDEFLAFHAADNCSISLQFRNGKLVNHNPKDIPDGP